MKNKIILIILPLIAAIITAMNPATRKASLGFVFLAWVFFVVDLIKSKTLDEIKDKLKQPEPELRKGHNDIKIPSGDLI